MEQPLSHPDTVGAYQLKTAKKLEDVIETPGVKGLWMRFTWRSVEVADGKFDWSLMDTDMAVARRHGLEFIVQITDRSFNGSQVLPQYFPSEYVLKTSGNGHVGYTSKRWDPYVYTRLIRLYKAIARRYADDPAFGGIATTETATGNFSGGDYTLEKYESALIEIVNQTEAALTRGKLFFYLNFLQGGDNSDMNKDARVKLLAEVPHQKLVVGAPDITPDVRGMPRSVTAYRIYAHENMPDLPQFCHLQNVDQGQHRINVKSNQYRQEYDDEVARVRDREQQSWFHGKPAVFEFDDLRDAEGHRVKLHPQSELGKLWTPEELFAYGRRNFGCDYVFWHYREFPAPGEFTWSDIQKVIEAHQCFTDTKDCRGGDPMPPGLH